MAEGAHMLAGTAHSVDEACSCPTTTCRIVEREWERQRRRQIRLVGLRFFALSFVVSAVLNFAFARLVFL